MEMFYSKISGPLIDFFFLQEPFETIVKSVNIFITIVITDMLV